MSENKEEKFEQSFQVSSPARLEVRNVRGSVEIHPGEDGTLQVTSIKHIDSGDAKLTEVELKQEEDGTVKVTARFPEGSVDWLFGTKPCKVDFIITAPHQCNLKVSGVSSDAVISGFAGACAVNSVSGDLDLRGMSGDISINMVSGDIELEGIDGSLRIHTVSGDVEGKKVSVKANLDTVSGSIKLKESNLPEVDGKTVSGNIELHTPLGEGPYRFHSVSGDVRFTVPAETRCSLEQHSISGRISNNLPQTSNSSDHGTQTADVQGGGVKVLLNSVSGKLSLAS